MDDSSPVAGPGGMTTSGDPVAEQRQVAELLADLRRSTAELAERLDAVAQQLDGLGPLHEQVQQLAARVDAIDVPSADTVATAVSGQVGDRIVDGLAPRVADVVLTRVAAVLVDQLASSVANTVQYGVGEHLRAANVESERRISAHVDEAVLALAEALLRRRRPGRIAPVGAPVTADQPAVAPSSPTQAGSATDEPVVPGVAELGAVPSVGLDPTDQQAEAEFEGRDVLAQDGSQGADAASQTGRDPTAVQTEAEAAGPEVPVQAAVTDAVPSAELDPADAQADAELEGRDVLAQDADGRDHPDGPPDTERTGGLATGGLATGDEGRRRPWWRPGG